MTRPLRLCCAGVAAAVALSVAEAPAQNPEKFERVVPAKPAPVAPRPSQGDTLMRAVMRKAERNEKEDGLCGRADWPESSDADVQQFSDTAKPGDLRYARRTGEGWQLCSATRVLQVFNEAGQRCLRMQIWGCRRGGECAVQTARHCRDKDGKWSSILEKQN